MVTDTRNHLDRAVGKHIDLHNLTLPELVPDDLVGGLRQRLLGIFLRNPSCGYNQVGGKMRFRQDAAVGVDIIVVAIGCHHVHDGHTLFQTDADMTVLSLVTFCLLNKRTFPECLFDVTGVDGHHGLG